MPLPPPSTPGGLVPCRGIWLDHFSLTAVPGGVLLAGGEEWYRDGGSQPRSESATGAMFWDAATRQWLSLSPMPFPLKHHAAVALTNGGVLLIGGRSETGIGLTSTLWWDPETRRFSEGPPLRWASWHPGAVTLADGSVLALAFEAHEDEEEDIHYGERGLCQPRAQLLRPGASTWQPAGETARLFPIGARLHASHERALLVGGQAWERVYGTRDPVAPPRATEIWERERLDWRSGGLWLEARQGPESVTLSDGRILVVGGLSGGQLPISAEVWDPRSERWNSAGALSKPRSGFTLTALPGGRAAVSGGFLEGRGPAQQTVELWDLGPGTWSMGMPLQKPRANHRAVSVGEGSFLVVGGSQSETSGASELTWELWRPESSAGQPGLCERSAVTTVYAGRIKDPAFTYTGESEAWRENIELLCELGHGMVAMSSVIRLAEAPGRRGWKADWATWIVEMSLRELKEYEYEHRGPRQALDMELRAKWDRLEDGRRYALIAVEGIGGGGAL